jgi:hypothetical protein
MQRKRRDGLPVDTPCRIGFLLYFILSRARVAGRAADHLIARSCA